MEELKETIIQYWPTILEYAFMVLAYFLVFMYRSKVKGSHDSVTALFKEQTQEAVKSNTILQQNVHEELIASKAAYQLAIDKIKGLEEKTVRLENALKALTIESEEVESNAKLCENESN